MFVSGSLSSTSMVIVPSSLIITDSFPVLLPSFISGSNPSTCGFLPSPVSLRTTFSLPLIVFPSASTSTSVTPLNSAIFSFICFNACLPTSVVFPSKEFFSISSSTILSICFLFLSPASFNFCLIVSPVKTNIIRSSYLFCKSGSFLILYLRPLNVTSSVFSIVSITSSFVCFNLPPFESISVYEAGNNFSVAAFTTASLIGLVIGSDTVFNT